MILVKARVSGPQRAERAKNSAPARNLLAAICRRSQVDGNGNSCNTHRSSTFYVLSFLPDLIFTTQLEKPCELKRFVSG